jgi:hypothetical protein
MITMKNMEIKRTMTKTYALVLTDAELDVIWDALTDLQNSSEPEVSEQASNVMDKLHEAVVS